MACAYIIVDMQISDREQYQQYMAAAPAAASAALAAPARATSIGALDMVVEHA